MIRGLLSAALLAFVVSGANAHAGQYGAPPNDLRARLDALVAAYPDHLVSHTMTEVIWRDGSRMAVSDGRTDKTFEELLNAPDIDDMFAFAYPAGVMASAPQVNHDPGRIRNEAFFAKIYGDCRNDGRPAMARVGWIRRYKGGGVKVTTINHIDVALARVSADLEKLPRKFVRYLIPSAGTYNCRIIAGTRRLSVHAYAAAIDINVKTADYWRWSKPDANGRYRWRNKIPMEIVEIFERHGFIWGGRWYHYDTMHFEYRPELILSRP